MANWCSTCIAFEGKRVGELVEVLKKIDKYKFPDDAGVSNTWTPLILVFSGEPVANYRFENGTFIEGDTQAEYQGDRSFIHDVVCTKIKDDNCLILHCEDAWGPASDLYARIAEKFDLELSYIAEEPGMGIYINHGNYFPDKYIYDTCNATGSVSSNDELIELLREDIKNNECISLYKSVFELIVSEMKEFSDYEDIDLVEDKNPLQPIISRIQKALCTEDKWYSINSYMKE